MLSTQCRQLLGILGGRGIGEFTLDFGGAPNGVR